MNKILLNRIRTPDGTILTSRHVHDYVHYRDKNGHHYIVDGGNYYLKRVIPIVPYEELSVDDDGTFETRRNACEWGQNYDINRNRLPKTVFHPIKDLPTDHILAILKNVKRIDAIWKDTMIKELDYRMQGWAE